MEFYHNNGFFLAKKCIKTRFLNKIENEIKNLFREDFFTLYKRDFNAFLGKANISQYLLSINELTTHQPIVKILKNLGLNNPVINTRPLVSYSHKDLSKNDMYWKVPAHQDWPSMQGSIDGVTVWIPLVELDESMGYLEVIPKSHLQGALKQKDNTVLDESSFDAKDFVPIVMNRGDVLIFNTFLIHRSGHNTSNKVRLTTHLRYDNADEESFIQRNYPHHRVDKRADGIAFPDLDTKHLINKLFVHSK